MGERQRGKDTRKQNSVVGYHRRPNVEGFFFRYGRGPRVWLRVQSFPCEARRPFLVLCGHAHELPESFYAPLEMD